MFSWVTLISLICKATNSTNQINPQTTKLTSKQLHPWNKNSWKTLFYKRNKKKVSLWAKHLDSSCIASLLRLQRSKKSWCLVHGFCKKVLKVFLFFFFFTRKRHFSILSLFFFFCQSDTNLMSWVEHKINDLSNSLMLRIIFFSIKTFMKLLIKKLFRFSLAFFIYFTSIEKFRFDHGHFLFCEEISAWRKSF